MAIHAPLSIEVLPLSRRLEPKYKLLVSTSTFVRQVDDLQPRFVLDLVKSLQSHFSIVVLAPSYPGACDMETIDGVKVIRFRYAPFRSLETLAYNGGIMAQLVRRPLKALLIPFFFWGQRRALSRLCSDQHFDAINAHWSIPQALIACTLQNNQRIPLITTCHGGDVYLFNKSPFKALLAFCLRRSNKVVAVSEELRELCAQLIGDSTKEKDLVRVPMGVHLVSYDGSKWTPASASAQESGDFVVTFVGRLVAKKGVATLIDAIHRLPKRLSSNRKVVLQIIGDGILRKSHENQAAALGLSDRVHFIGWRSQDQLPELLRTSDICVIPSLLARDGDKDGLPVALLEAAASGTPVIGSDVAGIPDYLIHEKNGLLCPPGDANALAKQLHRLMTDEELRQKLTVQGLEDVRSYDWHDIARRYAVIINEAIAEARA